MQTADQPLGTDEAEDPSNALPLTAPSDVDGQTPVDTEQDGSAAQLIEAQIPEALDPPGYVLRLLQNAQTTLK